MLGFPPCVRLMSPSLPVPRLTSPPLHPAPRSRTQVRGLYGPLAVANGMVLALELPLALPAAGTAPALLAARAVLSAAGLLEGGPPSSELATVRGGGLAAAAGAPFPLGAWPRPLPALSPATAVFSSADLQNAVANIARLSRRGVAGGVLEAYALARAEGTGRSEPTHPPTHPPTLPPTHPPTIRASNPSSV